MPKKSKASARRSTAKRQTTERDSASLALARQGIDTLPEFTDLFCAVMCDVIEHKLPPPVANAACNAAGKVLKAVELQLKYGKEAMPVPLVSSRASE